jgi:hypothetical protein
VKDSAADVRVLSYDLCGDDPLCSGNSFVCISVLFSQSESVRSVLLGLLTLSLETLTDVLRSLLVEDLLSRLLTSTHPDDLKAANKLIKEMVLEVSSPPSG